MLIGNLISIRVFFESMIPLLKRFQGEPYEDMTGVEELILPEQIYGQLINRLTWGIKEFIRGWGFYNS